MPLFFQEFMYDITLGFELNLLCGHFNTLAEIKLTKWYKMSKLIFRKKLEYKMLVFWKVLLEAKFLLERKSVIFSKIPQRG